MLYHRNVAEEVDFVVIGAGLAGLVAARLLPGSVVVIDPKPGRYKIGESIVPEQFAHPALAEMIPAIRELPSYAPKHGVTFRRRNVVAHFPVAIDREPGAMHVARHELERLFIERWSPRLIEAGVIGLDLASRRVSTQSQAFIARRLIIDASGPAMVVATHQRQVETLGPVSAAWRYFEVHGRHEGACFGAWSEAGNDVRTYDARRKKLLDVGDYAPDLHPGDGTVVTMLGDGRWCWQIPLFSGRCLSVGLVSRNDRPIVEAEYDRTVRGCTADLFELGSPFTASPFSEFRQRRGFARRARSAAGPSHVLLGDAFAFADPIYSIGTAVAVNQAITLVEHLREHTWDEQTAAVFDARGEALLQRSRRAFDFWYSGKLLEDHDVAAEVNDGFLVGGAFQTTAASTYGDSLEDATLRAGEHRDTTPVTLAGPPLETSEFPVAEGWALQAAARCTGGARMLWRSAAGIEVAVYGVRDPDDAVRAYRRAGGWAWYYEGTLDAQAAATLMDGLCEPAPWRAMLDPAE